MKRQRVRQVKEGSCGCTSRSSLGDDKLPIEPVQVVPGEPAPSTSCLDWVKLERVPSEYAECMTRLGKAGKITTAKDVFEILHDRLDREDQEVGIVLLLDVQLNVRGAAEVSRGERESTIVPIADILRIALVDGATAIVFCHNHPTGDSSPSDDDKTSTIALAQACTTVGLMLMDHVILGRGTFFSFADSGLLESSLVVPDEDNAVQVVPGPENVASEHLVEDRTSGARRGWEHRRERDEWVVQNLEPALIPLWTRMKGQFTGTPHERYDAFMAYVHDHPGEETEALQSGADSWLEQEIRAGRARENPSEAPEGEGKKMMTSKQVEEFETAIRKTSVVMGRNVVWAETRSYYDDDGKFRFIRVTMTDPAAGGTVQRDVSEPSDPVAVGADMVSELRGAAKGTRQRIRTERGVNRS